MRIMVVVSVLIITLRALRSTAQTDRQKTMALVFLWNMVRKSNTVSEIIAWKVIPLLVLIREEMDVIVVLAPFPTQWP